MKEIYTDLENQKLEKITIKVPIKTWGRNSTSITEVSFIIGKDIEVKESPRELLIEIVSDEALRFLKDYKD